MRVITRYFDWILLKLFRGSFDLFREQLPYREYLLLPAFNIYDFITRKSDPLSDWTKSLRTDKSRSCFRAEPIKDSSLRHCVLDACQTIEAMSGAPIFAFDYEKKTLFIGGIHLRAGLLDDDPQVRANRECGSLDKYNIGITLPRSVLSHITTPEKK
jgi:hypothetical protein